MDPLIIEKLFEVIEQRRAASPDQSYVARLMAKGPSKICEKIAEETQEVIEASQEDDKTHQIHEACDLLFHLFVLCSQQGIGLDDLKREFTRRFGTSGLDEKRNRKKS